jgi:hypothetical protein
MYCDQEYDGDSILPQCHFHHPKSRPPKAGPPKQAPPGGVCSYREATRRRQDRLNHLQVPTDIALLFVLWQLRYMLSLRDLGVGVAHRCSRYMNDKIEMVQLRRSSVWAADAASLWLRADRPLLAEEPVTLRRAARDWLREDEQAARWHDQLTRQRDLQRQIERLIDAYDCAIFIRICGLWLWRTRLLSAPDRVRVHIYELLLCYLVCSRSQRLPAARACLSRLGQSPASICLANSGRQAKAFVRHGGRDEARRGHRARIFPAPDSRGARGHCSVSVRWLHFAPCYARSRHLRYCTRRRRPG